MATRDDFVNPEYLKEALSALGCTTEETTQALKRFGVAMENLDAAENKTGVLVVGSEKPLPVMMGEAVVTGHAANAIRDELVEGLKMMNDQSLKRLSTDDLLTMEDVNTPMTLEEMQIERQRRRNQFTNQLKKNMKKKKTYTKKARRKNTRKARRMNRRR